MELNSKTIKKILLLVFLSAIIIWAVFNMGMVIGFLAKLFSYISPIVAALCIAFILNVLLRVLETKVFFFFDKAKHKFVRKIKRPLCLVLTYLLAIGIISLLVLVIIPDLIDTVIFVVKSLPSFLKDAREWVVGILSNFGIAENKIPTINFDINATVNTLQNLLSDYSNTIVNGAANITSSVVGGLYDTVFSIIISVYILAQKERIGRFLKKVINSFIPKKFSKTVYYISSHASESFSRFIGGQLTESVILGVLCYIGMLIFRFPNAAIISVLIAVSSLVPIVGAIVGVVIGALLIVITNPIKALFFILFILILQQIEGNVIYPKVVGKAVGLPSIMVVSAVLIGGNIGGILGVLLSVPLSALLFTLLKEAIANKKKIKVSKQEN
ncbi:MAG: AI-2E family transporter [Clostridia bacterium]|nr:AI-2E family transporter [Clostridia bacterium]